MPTDKWATTGEAPSPICEGLADDLGIRTRQLGMTHPRGSPTPSRPDRQARRDPGLGHPSATSPTQTAHSLTAGLRAPMRHGVSIVLSGQRHALVLIFHNAT